MSKIFLLFCLNSLLFFNIEKGFANDNKYFHPPHTDAEKSLDLILSNEDLIREEKGVDIFNCLRIYNKREKQQEYEIFYNNKGKPFKMYKAKLAYNQPDPKELEKCREFFTDDLMQKASAKERKIGQDCFMEDPCGFEEINPIQCSQDTPTQYLYYTHSDDGNQAFIQTAWSDYLATTPIDKKKGFHYKMTKDKQDNKWKLDELACF